MDLTDAVEAAAKACHEKIEASALRFAARVVEADGRGDDLNWDGTTCDYEAHIQEERERLEWGPVAWEDASEKDRERVRDYVRDAVESAAPCIVGLALREVADELSGESPFALDEDTAAHLRVGPRWARIFRNRARVYAQEGKV